MEAGAEGFHSSDEDDGSEMEDFICNSVIIEDDDDADESRVDIQAKYLESLRSPSSRRIGGFKIPELKSLANFSNIYSQMPDHEELDEYEEDSFIDVEDDQHCETQLDELEQAEAILKARRKEKKYGIKSKISNKRRIIYSLDDESDDEEIIQRKKKIKSMPG